MYETRILKGRYRILRLLGRGGMADVYLAQDERRQVQVAIKVLREDLAEDPDFLRRFAREARALAQLDHPNIVRFYSFEQDGLVAFMVMDYVDGVTLRRLLAERQGPLRLEEVTSILQQVGAALHYAHGKGIIHRDLKPGNIMLQRDGKVLLTDFGIAKLMESATMTAAGIGTPAYMSPEQILNQGVDQRTDIYSLGVMAYQMATGRRPFTGEERGLTESGTGSRMREAHLRLAPPQPTTLNPALPVEAGHVIMRALAKRPEDRWPDVMSMVRAWERAVGVQSRAPVVTLGRENLSPTPTPPTGPPISPASPSPVLSEPTPPSTGGKRIWPVLAGVGVVVVAALLGLWLLLPRASDEPPVAGAPVPPPTSSPMVQTTPLPTAMKVEAPTTDVAGTAQALAATYAAATAEVKETMAAEAEVRARATMTVVAATATYEAKRMEEIAAATATARAEEDMRLRATATAQARVAATLEAQQEATREAIAQATREARAQATRTAVAKATARAAGPPSCSIPVGGPFQALWRQPSVYNKLGCPTGAAHQSMSAEERFERGFMLWRDSSDSVYVLFDDGTWTVSQDHFVEGRDPEYSCGVPQSPPSPRRGFSKVWCYHPGVKDKIGNAVEREVGYGMAGGGPAEIFQDFEGGMMYQSNHFHAVYALFSDFTWRR